LQATSNARKSIDDDPLTANVCGCATSEYYLAVKSECTQKALRRMFRRLLKRSNNFRGLLYDAYCIHDTAIIITDRKWLRICTYSAQHSVTEQSLINFWARVIWIRESDSWARI